MSLSILHRLVLPSPPGVYSALGGWLDRVGMLREAARLTGGWCPVCGAVYHPATHWIDEDCDARPLDDRLLAWLVLGLRERQVLGG